MRDIFLLKAKNVHGNKYDYSLVDYKNNKTKVKIVCPEHGCFEQTPYHHIKGKIGCKRCADDSKKMNTEIFIERSRKIHNNKYDYSIANYKGIFNKVKIICPEHGIFEQYPNSHVNKKRGCLKCGGTLKLTNEIFINKSVKIHNNIYDYSISEYNIGNEEVNIICKKHGVFKQQAESHLQGRGCPKCKSSKGELKISNLLENLKIKYVSQKTFENCKNKKCLPFDFYLPSINLCIEYDGIHHSEPIRGQKLLEYTIKNDEIKNNFCKINNINLLRIRYDENIEEKLKNNL